MATPRRIKLLAPGGDVDSIKAAIVAGADAVYCGLDKLNARHRAANISLDELYGVIALAHEHHCQVFLTLNTMLVDSDIPVLIGLLNKLSNTKIDGVIIQDLGMFHLLSRYYPGLKIHASTQLTTHNEGQLEFLEALTASRVNLSRELNIHEITELTRVAHEHDLRVEVFAHGSYCLCFSGICYMSSVIGGLSGNRGKCSQPCRDRYLLTPMGKAFPLNLKDNSAYCDLELLADAGVDALKIEGRMKNFHYVYTVTHVLARRLQSLHDQHDPADHSEDLHRVFNRGFSNAYLTGAMDRQMFTDDPRNHAAKHLREEHGWSTGIDWESETEPFDEIAETAAAVKSRIDQVSFAKAPAVVSISGEFGAPLKVSIKAADASLSVQSELRLSPRSGARGALERRMLQEQFKVVNRSRYYIERLDLDDLQDDLFMPFKELNSMKKRILCALNGLEAAADAVDVPVLPQERDVPLEPALSVLISSQEDLYLCDETGVDVHLQLPNHLGSAGADLADLFLKNRRLIPWFPAVLIGGDYAAAVELLHRVRPERVVTNNSGIAHEAHRAGIRWIAGPFLNIANSLSLLTLKEDFDCYGAFISNELGFSQISRLRPPREIKLYYSMYHPIMLLTSRQCLFHQVTGCEKDRIEEACIEQCERSSSITNMRDVSFLLRKTRGNYCGIYSETHFLNTAVVTDFPALFSGYLIDLRGIETETRVAVDKPTLIRLFQGHLHGDADSLQKLTQCIQPTTNTQYARGI